MGCRPIRAAAGISGAALLLAACGGGAPPQASSPPAISASGAGVPPASGQAAGPSVGPAAPAAGSSAAKPSASTTAAAPYQIAAVLDLTGPYAPLGVPIKGAMELESKKLNAGGGIGGHPIELLVEDSASDPSKGILVLKKLLDQKPVAEIGPSFSSVAMATIPLFVQNKLPALTGAADEEQVQPIRKYVFMTPPTSVQMVSVLTPYMKGHNISNIALIHDTTSFGNSGPRDFKAAEAQSGVHVVGDETYNLTDKDMTPQLTKLKNNPQVQAVVLWGAGATPAIVTKNFHALGFKVPLITNNSASTYAFLQAAGEAAEGTIVLAYKVTEAEFLPATDPSRQLLESFAPEYKQATGQEADAFVAAGYDAFHIMANAIREAGTDPDKIVDALEHAKFTGLRGSYAYSPTSHAGLTPDSLLVTRVEKGKFVPVK